jgi:hypothetical protein
MLDSLGAVIYDSTGAVLYGSEEIVESGTSAWATGAWAIGAWAAGAWSVGESGSSDVVTLLGAALTDKTHLTLYFSDIVSIGSGGSSGISAALSGGSVTWTYSSGIGTNAISYASSRNIGHNEYGNGAYVNPSEGLEDVNGADIESFSFDVRNRIVAVPVHKWWK